MSYPANGPATLGTVKEFLGKGDNRDDTRITRIVAAVNAWVLQRPVASVADGADDWSGPELAHLVEGASMLAGRLFRRKDSALGVASFGADGAVYVQRNDPDIAMLLGLGHYSKPRVG